MWDMYMCGAGRGSGAVTSPRPPRCSSRGPSRRRDRDRGTCAASPGQTPWRWSQSPSSLSSFSVFGLPGLLETVGGEDTSLGDQLFLHYFSPSLTPRIMDHVVPVPKNIWVQVPKNTCIRMPQNLFIHVQSNVKILDENTIKFLKPVWWNLQ